MNAEILLVEDDRHMQIPSPAFDGRPSEDHLRDAILADKCGEGCGHILHFARVSLALERIRTKVPQVSLITWTSTFTCCSLLF
jgi:hypothetical protein